MQDFIFRTTKSVLYEPGATGRIGELMSDMGCRKVAFVTDSMILELGLADAALEGLRERGVDVWVFSDVKADPPEDVVLKAVAAAEAEKIDGVVSVGGGSSLDTAKLMAILCNSTQPLDAMYGVDKVEVERLPLVLAPTTAGTGSEVTPVSIVTTSGAEKKGVSSGKLLPDWAVLDADLTLGLPRKVTAATGIDAMVHCIEAYTSKIKKNIMSDCLARQGLALLGANIHRVCEKPDDREARGSMLLGSMLAGMAFANAPVAAVHALAYPLGGHFHVPHGLSNSLVLPYVMAYNLSEAAPLYAELAPLMFPDLSGCSDTQCVDAMLERIGGLSEALGLEHRLSQVGVKEADLDMLANDAMKQTRLLVNNPREMTRDAAYDIYRQAM